MITVLDIGNTNLGWAIYDGDTVIASGYGDNWRDHSYDRLIIGSNVQIPLDIMDVHSPFVLSDYRNLIYGRYQIPHNVGFDRAANLYGAGRLSSSADFAVIDCGSATTITVVRDNIFAGGAISIGLGKSRQAVSDYFPAIAPYMDKPYKADSEPFGLYTDSQDAINMGLIGMQAAYISAYITKLNEMGITDIFLTGGDSDMILKYLKNENIRHENLLTLMGYMEEYRYIGSIG